MKYLRVHNIRLQLEDDRRLLRNIVAERLGIDEDSIKELKIARRSLDARQKHRIKWVYSVDVLAPTINPATLKSEGSIVDEIDPFRNIRLGKESLPGRPVIVGSGPSGLFAAYILAKYGLKPLVLDRGGAVRERVRDVRLFWKGGQPNSESNLLFGEGGAGTFSDGKLTCRSSSPLIPFLLKIMVENRAPEEILYETRPHIGTDRLRAVLVTLRKRMEKMGVEFRFNTRMDDLVVKEGSLIGLDLGEESIPTGPVFLGIGHSARDTYKMLHARGVAMEFKPFQFGVRVEHSQELIDRAQYGQAYGHSNLSSAEYVLVGSKDRKKQAVFSFCMCPGGVVLPSINEPGTLCTNGMSNHKRNSGSANSGIVMTVGHEEMKGTDPFRGIHFQKRYESIGFHLGGGKYSAPAQRIPDFLKGHLSGHKFKTTYPLGYVEADIRELLPSNVARSIASALKEFDKKLPGFSGQHGTITGPESRGSSPIRMLRDDTTGESTSIKNLYPIGEGAGYAGGIVSAAIDGIKSALKVVERFAAPR